ncbi:MAG TPA: metallophosphoesterase family protein [Candidatus Elarobacter sp.]|jgi:putative phosphoesterase|nr:metallophosphoesterase family protein [Candidatus Elarobacter sp.]
MRIAILSDIHGNAHALGRCLDDLASRGGADVVVAAGDLCMDGPRPKQVLKRLRDAGARALRGNTDRMIGEGNLAELDPEDARGVAWTRAQIGGEWTRWLAELPQTLSFGDGDDGLLVCHANPKSDDEHVWPDASDEQLERVLAGVPQRTIAFGHLHLAYVRVWRDRTLVNVASAGLPKDGDAHAHYAILTQRAGGWEVQSRRVPFDVAKVERQLRASGIPDVEKRVQTLRRHRYPKLGAPGSVIP